MPYGTEASNQIVDDFSFSYWRRTTTPITASDNLKKTIWSLGFFFCLLLSYYIGSVMEVTKQMLSAVLFASANDTLPADEGQLWRGPPGSLRRRSHVDYIVEQCDWALKIKERTRFIVRTAYFTVLWPLPAQKGILLLEWAFHTNFHSSSRGPDCSTQEGAIKFAPFYYALLIIFTVQLIGLWVVYQERKTSELPTWGNEWM